MLSICVLFMLSGSGGGAHQALATGPPRRIDPIAHAHTSHSVANGNYNRYTFCPPTYICSEMASVQIPSPVTKPEDIRRNQKVKVGQQS